MRRRIAWLLLYLAGAGLLYGAASLALTLRTGQDLVELRNSFLVEVRPGRPFQWSPPEIPEDFLWETAAAPALVQEAAARFDPGAGLTGLERILVISRQLGDGRPSGQATQATTEEALLAITRSADGYCADYTQVLNALALTAGIPIREWGMSFDGYNGAGHAFNEIYDASRQKWIFVDTYHSFYVTDAGGVPLSVAQLRSRLIDRDYNSIAVIPIAQNKFKFDTLAGAKEYYARGAHSFFMIWGNNVFSYDQDPLLRMARHLGRPVEQALAIVSGAQPRIVVPETWINREGMEGLERLRTLFWLCFASAIVLVSATVYLVLTRRQRPGKLAPVSKSV